MVSGRTGCLLAASLLMLSAVSHAEDEFIFDEEAAEEAVSSHVPKFTSKSLELVVKPGDSVTLPCLVDKLGDHTVIIWTAGDDTLFTASIQSTPDQRFSLEDAGQLGNSLVIQGVTEKDSRVYQCQITSNPAITLKHHVMIQSPPSVTVRPRSGVKVVEEGKEVVLECSADGFPEPTVTWTKKGGLLPYQEKKHTGERYVIPAVKGAHMGDYFCTAENGVGDPVVEHIRLEVNFAPQIEVANEIVYTGTGHKAELECTVQGQPLPTVMWYRVKGTPLDEAHYERYEEGYTFGLRIANVKDDDLGVYSCQAENVIGKHTAIVHLTGKPKPVNVLSEPNGDEDNMYNIRWSVESYAEPIEYKILYRKVQEEEGEPDEDWSELVVAYSADPAQPDSSLVYQQKAVLKELEAASVYQAIVTARNRHGWSEPAAAPFRFSTRGASKGGAGVKGGEALVSERRSGSGAESSLARPAAVGLLSGLLAAFVTLL